MLGQGSGKIKSRGGEDRARVARERWERCPPPYRKSKCVEPETERTLQFLSLLLSISIPTSKTGEDRNTHSLHGRRPGALGARRQGPLQAPAGPRRRDRLRGAAGRQGGGGADALPRLEGGGRRPAGEGRRGAASRGAGEERERGRLSSSQRGMEDRNAVEKNAENERRGQRWKKPIEIDRRRSKKLNLFSPR